jgi:LysR family transcriptional regulator, hydrogen peroxide-inducible genes activator
MPLPPHPFTLRQLQYAVAVADERNFHRAARSCRVAQPSLSAQLAQLEDVLGVRLFERDRRRVLPTQAGEELVARARRILLETDDLVRAARRFVDPLSGTLRFGVIPTISPYLVPSATSALRAHFASLVVHWIEDKTPNLVEELEAGRLDAVLLALEAPLGQMDHAVIGLDPFVLAGSAEHPLLKSHKPVELGALANAEVLLLDEGHCLREQALELCASSSASEASFRATSLSTLATMVADGRSVTLLPSLAVPVEAGRAGLRIRAFAAPAPVRTIVLGWRPRSPLAGPLEKVAEVLRRAFPLAEPPAAKTRAKR